MIFTLEALPAAQGDCLLLHYGTRRKPLVAVVDGGPGGVYRQTLRPRLDELRESRAGDGALPLQLVMVSHIDDDHIHGILDLLGDVARGRDEGESRFDVQALWHNSFEDIVGGDGPASLPSARLSAPSELLVASIGQGRALRDAAERLDLEVNHPYDEVVQAPREVDWGDGLALTVLGPDEERLHDLREQWERTVRRGSPSEATVAAYLDRSVYNLSSIVVLARVRRKRMLLTGDARGDDVLAGLRGAGLLRRPPLRVDVLKLPHHGSDRNVDTDFFRAIVADHYVVSADGTDNNPEISTLQMVSDSRDDDDFVLHLTYRDGANRLGARLKAFERKERRAGRKYEIRYPEGRPTPSLRIDLLDTVDD